MLTARALKSFLLLRGSENSSPRRTGVAASGNSQTLSLLLPSLSSFFFSFVSFCWPPTLEVFSLLLPSFFFYSFLRPHPSLRSCLPLDLCWRSGGQPHKAFIGPREEDIVHRRSQSKIYKFLPPSACPSLPHGIYTGAYSNFCLSLAHTHIPPPLGAVAHCLQTRRRTWKMSSKTCSKAWHRAKK